MYRIALFLLLFFQFSFSQNILDLKNRATIIKEIQKDRIENLLPSLMKETGIDMWIIITRDYNEEPIIKKFLPAHPFYFDENHYTDS